MRRDPSEVPLPAFAIECRRPLLAIRFPKPQRMLSWSLSQPGFTVASAVAWLEAADADGMAGRDRIALLAERLMKAGLSDAVGMITSRDIRSFRLASETIDQVTATAITTVGLRNGELVGSRRFSKFASPPPPGGTINTLVHVSAPLSDEALLETLSIVTQARTVAVLDTTMRRGGDVVSGAGSDCIVVATPPGGTLHYAGLQTAVGEAVGAAVLTATRGAVSCWLNDSCRPSPAGEDKPPPRP